MITQSDITINGSTPPSTVTQPVVPYSGILKSGSRGDSVRSVQEQLLAAGYDPGPIDGIFGPKTEAAVRKFQEAYAPPIDGIVGPITQKALNERSQQTITSTEGVIAPPASESASATPETFVFEHDYTLEEIQQSLDAMYASAPPLIKERAAHNKAIVEKSKQRMRRTYVQHSEKQWG